MMADNINASNMASHLVGGKSPTYEVGRGTSHYQSPFTPPPTPLPQGEGVRGRSGFTLVELAIVLVIIGLLVGLGASLIGPLTKRTKYTETKETIDAGVESIVGYAASNERIPIWGDYTSDTTVDEFIEVVKNPNDSWVKPLYYFFENLLTSTDSVCNRRTTNLTLCRDATCTSRIPDIAFVVVSSSEDYNPQTGIVTTGCPGGQTCVGVYDVDTPNIDNCTGAANCPNYPAGMDRISRPEPYDDIVKWVTLNELRIKAGCIGAQLKVVNNELPYGFENSSYSATVIANGGVAFTDGGDLDSDPDYEWCTSTSAPSGLSYNCNGTLNSSATCSLIVGTWNRCTSLTISGTPTCLPSTDGSYPLTFFVRDNNDSTGPNDNIAEKTFVLTVNPIILCP
jgi:prepilin-type N-terminal cleavage/methylation domain-containing protein